MNRNHFFGTLLIAVSLFSYSCEDKNDWDLEGTGTGTSPKPKPTPALVSYTWPTEPGQAKLSEHYQVFVQVGDEPEIELEVIQSDAIVEKKNLNGTMGEDFQASYTKQRTFSFVNVSYDESKGQALTFRVKALSASASKVELAPASYGLTATSSGNEATFTVDKYNRYIAVNFDDPSNIVKYNVAGPNGTTNSYDWVKNMLCIFVDPPEKKIPNMAMKKIAYFKPDITADELINADVIYFKPGYYNLLGMNLNGAIDPSIGQLILQNEQMVYIEGGAFVEGVISRTNFGDTKQGVMGRGILSGRQYVWEPGNDERKIHNLVNTGNHATFEGVMFMESPHHGIVPTNDASFDNVKFLGWHCNNDGLRPGNNSRVTNCFIRAYDDFFYNYCLDVSDCVLWPGFNGSIMTYGWASIDIGGSTMDNIDIIYPEWKGMGNNCGLIMSQNEYRFNPVNGTTVIKNIRIEGEVPGFVNLKANSNYGGPNTEKYCPLESASELGWLGNLVLENITVNKQVGQRERGMAANLIRGAKGVVKGDPNSVWWTKDITLRNITIGGVKITEENKDDYFTIEAATTKNIVFE